MYPPPHLPQPQISHSSIPPSQHYQSHQTLYVPPIAYNSPQFSTKLMTKFPQIDSGLAVHVFNQGDDSIACLNKAMAFLITVASSRRQGQSYAGTSYKGNATTYKGNNVGGQTRVVKCYNCQGEGHMARQCTHPKRPRNDEWFKKKAMLAEAQEFRQILDEEQLSFLADPGIPNDVISENDLSKSYSQLEKHCISLELTMQLDQEIVQKDSLSNNQNAFEIPEYFENNDLKAQLQAKDTIVCKLKEHINSMRENDKEEKVKHKMDEIETINIKLEDIEQTKAKQPLDNALDFACKIAKRIQELLVYVQDKWPNANKPSEKLVAVTPMNKVKKVRFSEPLTSSSNIKQGCDVRRIEEEIDLVFLSDVHSRTDPASLDEAVARHGVHVSSIPDKDGMYIETDGQSERTFRTLENMFRACVRNLVVVGILTFREVSFPTKIVIIRVFDEFSLEVLYGRREFSVGDHVMMKVSPWKGVVRFDKKGELAPRYIGPIEILERIGPVAYRLRLPDELSIGNYLSGVKISSKPEIALIL
ncbi:retrovirus-related pol polyprotein from transposon TNT 1-94 [Tanacetum coccineum]